MSSFVAMPTAMTGNDVFGADLAKRREEIVGAAALVGWQHPDGGWAWRLIVKTKPRSPILRIPSNSLARRRPRVGHVVDSPRAPQRAQMNGQGRTAPRERRGGLLRARGWQTMISGCARRSGSARADRSESENRSVHGWIQPLGTTTFCSSGPAF